MCRPSGRCLGLGLVAVAFGALACGGDDGTGPPAVAAVEVVSPIGNRLAVGRTVQLGATARDARGSVLTVPVTWSSSATAVAPVNATGLVSGAAAGSATLSAQAGGVTGSLAVQVIAADLNGIPVALDDAFTTALVAHLTSAVRARVQAALGQCRDGAGQGNFTTIETCLASARSEVTAAADPTDRALLATLALFFDHIERLLNA